MAKFNLYFPTALLTYCLLCSFTALPDQRPDYNDTQENIGKNAIPSWVGADDILDIEKYHRYIDAFNRWDKESQLRKSDISNDQTWDFLVQNIPFFDCPDKQLERTYYFRWWTYRKHIKHTPDGYIVTEFYPNVSWAGLHNSICCPAAHHFMEGRWLKNPVYLSDYARFWMNGKSSPRQYSFWPADAITQFAYVHPHQELLKELFPKLENNFSEWQKSHQDSTGLFWQIDGYDGMEVSISGSYNHSGGKGYRATINSYMYAETKALAQMAQHIGDKAKYKLYTQYAENLKTKINRELWDKNDDFYKVMPYGSKTLADVRELHGYTPWYFNIPPQEYACAWKFIMDTRHFFAPYGLTTAEQCHPLFRIDYTNHECQWNGPVWPYSTAIILTAMANLLNNYEQNVVTPRDYYTLLTQYSKMHSIDLNGDGRQQPWIDENMNPYTGDWIARTRLKTWKYGMGDEAKGEIERGKDYNHSTFNDLIITGLIGLRPDESNELTIHPLVSEKEWDYFCLDRVYYKGNKLTVLYDKYGTRYGKGKGFFVYLNGKIVATDSNICKKTIRVMTSTSPKTD